MKPEQITAWALDEASAEERQQLEAELRDNPTTKKAAVETKDFCHFLLAELRDDSLALTDEQRERLKAVSSTPAAADPALPQAWAAVKKAELQDRRALPKWRTSIGLRLGLAACLTVGCVVAWQQYEMKARHEVAARTQASEAEEQTYKISPNSRHASSGSVAMAMPSETAPRPLADRVSEHLLREQRSLPGLPAASPNAGLPGSPGAPASVLAGTATMTPGDVTQLKRIQDQNAYGLNFGDGTAMPGAGLPGLLPNGPPPATPLDDSSASLVVGAGGISKNGGATLVLNGANTYTGGTVVGTGSVMLASSGGIAPPPAPAGSFAPAATPVSSTESTLTLANGVVSSASGLTKSGAGTLNMPSALPPQAGVAITDTAGATATFGGSNVVKDAGANAQLGGMLKVNGGAPLVVSNPEPVRLTVSGAAGALESSIGGQNAASGMFNNVTVGQGNATPPPAPAQAVGTGLMLANSSTELGNYDAAISQYQDVLRVDPYNGAARRGMEEAEKKRSHYFKTAYDHQRAKMLTQVDEAWEEKVPLVASTGNVTANTGDHAATMPISDPTPDARYFSKGASTLAPQSEPKPNWQTPAERISSTESYQRIIENELKDVAREPLSTFSIDVDTAAYANMRRFLNQHTIPPADAVRIEELINYFPAAEEGPAPGAKEPFGVRVEMAPCPWQPQHRLARIAIKGRELGAERKASNLVFLVDVSGSMGEPAKLPLVQQSLRMLTEQLGEGDRVTMVVYAGSSGLVLPPTNGEDKQTILAAIDRLNSGGSTHGSAGIQLAYEQAVAGFIKDGVNRVILCTDGDFNVGVSSPEELEKLITRKAKSGVFLSVLGFGSGNLKDRTMETLADKGNGNYAYIDSLSEARKVLVEQMSGTLVTIAKDVKIQVEFNPAAVRSYRLIGYENRLMAKEDFNDDTKDAGDIGAGHSVVALYEVVPANLPPGAEPRPPVDNLRYQTPATPAIPPAQLAEAARTGEVMTVKLRYKEPDSSLSKLIEVPAKDEGKTLTASTEEFKFSAAVAGFGLLLRDSAYKGTLGWETVRKLALDGKGSDKLGYRGEFLQLIDKARGLKETRE
ncbi:MAG: YfbK domain-containing protein [Prosthecobacter sp.]